MIQHPKPSCSLRTIFAREAPVAVIFRRGPSHWVQVIRWQTDTDAFEPGQWFHGRIYEDFSDLSPDGSKLVYFAAKPNLSRMGEEPRFWIGISRPPYLTALAIWFRWNCADGGGEFETNDRVKLYLSDLSDARADRWAVPEGQLKIVIGPARYYDRGTRIPPGPWEFVQAHQRGEGWRRWYTTVKPGIRQRRRPDGDELLVRTTSSVRHNDVSRYKIQWPDGEALRIPDATWADWDQRGRLVYAVGGRLFASTIDESRAIHPSLLADFTANKFEQVEAPDWARTW